MQFLSKNGELFLFFVSCDYYAKKGDKHKFSKGFKKLISACLSKDHKKRQPVKDLLKQSFFKSNPCEQEYIAKNVLQKKPKKKPFKRRIPESVKNGPKNKTL